ncbi:uncharacterized protein MONOS_17422 [Monocercomonoides exilis]|uniref:uncharacterized protein n=1 Tax=Monocercomonoides exilis TaxID=2049356 RepID=UPI0035593FDF|nr:hypothetical protein MONOS_17422 [Monocercomonoides exilis]
MTEMDNTKKFNELFSELEHFDKEEQKHTILEMNGLVEGMAREEFKAVFAIDLFDRTNNMIKEKKLSMENSILILKNIGYHRMLINLISFSFLCSSLKHRFEKMIVDEGKKKEGKNEKLLIDLCECYLLLDGKFSSELILICIPCLLKVALRKEENEEAQKEVEMALLALSNIKFNNIERNMYLCEIKEIIQYHQEHLNLTRLAYQSVWEFLINRFYCDKNLEDTIADELYFVREATRELWELSERFDWKRKKEKERKKGRKQELVLLRWLLSLNFFFGSCELFSSESARLIGSIVNVYGTVKDNFREISNSCLCTFANAAGNKAIKVDFLLKDEAVDIVFEEINRSTIYDRMEFVVLEFFIKISRRLKEKEKDEMEEEKRKELKRKVHEKMEEEGFEDVITMNI